MLARKLVLWQSSGISKVKEDAERGLVAGKCYWRTNADGNLCDRCKNTLDCVLVIDSSMEKTVINVCQNSTNYLYICETSDSSFYYANISHYVCEAQYDNLTSRKVETRESPTQNHEQT
ncbi:hypothetical protein GCK72_026033 [Caenorhabditis remanei]|uniref:Uncharacterized protein n=1 Tax=Caenorhabditis remanei TaxID=31234 RepID=A0A6A5G4D4_CAERE|nr:hypothetical protein GCK72_026033 [Caenorhabditis remanei]KAF1749565.1 hypothetical protein GCK72_026033 [Caenorhabditis remanei]